jgi:hypothetical protein
MLQFPFLRKRPFNSTTMPTCQEGCVGGGKVNHNVIIKRKISALLEIKL